MAEWKSALEMLGLDPAFWRGRSVLVTGHTGFKGSWLTLWLGHMGAQVAGYALPAPTNPSLFEAAGLARSFPQPDADVRDYEKLRCAFAAAEPEVVFHLAAQSLVRESYREPLSTIATNVLGTANVLEVARHTSSVRAVVVVTSDKCYENREWLWPYRENEALGGHDPYSASKACAELVTATWRASFPRPELAVGSARAGNVIGGGDWAAERLVPDALRAWSQGESLQVRHPGATRPWQHVLEPLHGYLLLAQALHRGQAAEAWNFGPGDEDMVPVAALLDRLARHWGAGARWQAQGGEHPHEASLLRLDSTKARMKLGWKPVWSLDEAVGRTVAWHRAWLAGRDMQAHSLDDIACYQALASERSAK